MTQHPDLFAALAAPFEPHEVKKRTQSGRDLHYITARTVMNRLDSVLGPENWTEDYTPGENSVLCRLTITLPDGKPLTKADAGGYAGMADSGDDDKSGYSDAFKRAAVKLGVGRYLYRDGVPAFVSERAPAAAPSTPPTPAAAANQVTGQWGGGDGPPAQNGHAARSANGHGGPPRSGKALFAYVKDAEQTHQVALLKYVNSFIKLQEMPSRLVDLNPEQVAVVYAEIQRKLQTIGSSQADAYDEAYAQ